MEIKMDTKQQRIRVLMFPWLAHGHISPYLELAKKLINKHFYIYFCSTAINLNSIDPNISLNHSLSIQFIELKLPLLPELPSYYHTTNGLPPHLMNTLKKAFDMSSNEFAQILKTLNPDLLIYDFIQPWAPKLASSLHIPAVHFFCTSTVMSSFFFHALKNRDFQGFPFPEIYLNDYFTATKSFDYVLENSSGDYSDKERLLQSFQHSSNIVLIKSFRELEGKYMDYLSILVNKRIIPTGPLVQVDDMKEHDESEKGLLEWLSKKRKASTVFVSFGSEYFLSKKDREAIAEGLELSELNFIWVIRFPVGDKDKPKLEEALPDGYLERIGERGMVVEGWAPQAKILQHPSICGFVSHCGWSSIMESLKFGVPIIAMPMHLDQPFNARLVDDVGVGVEVKRGKDGRLEREEISKVIKQVVGEKDGENIRSKARDMSKHITNMKGDEEVDEAIEELIQIIYKGGRRTGN